MNIEKDKILQELNRAIVRGEIETARCLAERTLKSGFLPLATIQKSCLPAIEEVGRLWEVGDYFLPELIAGAEAMKAAMSVLQVALKDSGQTLESSGKVVIGTVEGDIHDIGKNLVASMLRATGFEVIDLGADVKLEKFIEIALREKAEVIALSALLTTTMLNQKRFVGLLVNQNLRQEFKVIVGGAPVSERWAREIGADGYGESAVQAVELVREILKKK